MHVADASDAYAFTHTLDCKAIDPKLETCKTMVDVERVCICCCQTSQTKQAKRNWKQQQN